MRRCACLEAVHPFWSCAIWGIKGRSDAASATPISTLETPNRAQMFEKGLWEGRAVSKGRPRQKIRNVATLIGLSDGCEGNTLALIVQRRSPHRLACSKNSRLPSPPEIGLSIIARTLRPPMPWIASRTSWAMIAAVSGSTMPRLPTRLGPA